MRQVTLPLSAMILSPGKCCVAELRPGDRVNGYDIQQRRVTVAHIIEVEPVESAEVVITFQQYRTVSFVVDSVGLTITGEWPMSKANLLTRYMGYCTKDQKSMLERPIKVIGRSLDHVVKAVRLTWEGPKYIWSNGILVGNGCPEADN